MRSGFNRNALIYLTMCFVGLALLAVCKDSISGDNDDGFDIEAYSGSPYTGPATLTLTVPNQGSASGDGTGTAQMIDQGNGQATFNLEALIEINGEGLSLGLPFTGHYDETGWIEIEGG